jgi:hypothetical protein
VTWKRKASSATTVRATNVANTLPATKATPRLAATTAAAGGKRRTYADAGPNEAAIRLHIF